MRAYLTRAGKKLVSLYIAELKAKQKEILDAKKDTAVNTKLPTEADIESEIPYFEIDGEYFNSWGVTDHYDADNPICLTRNIHYVIEEVPVYHEYIINE